ncbi:MAG: lysophospholipid acyltransferase family protein [Bacteroidales bacterium]|nr:lysophospholipid acyltransferase family protein [Bacteroidales bacterium]
MKTIGFWLVYVFLWLLMLLPLRLLYVLSDLLFLVIYYIIGYRKKVVFENLTIAFPALDEKEKTKIARKFYHHFCDQLIETAKIIHISKKNLDKRYVYENPELFDDFYKNRKSVVLVLAHYGNWEWLVNIQPRIKHRCLAIYKPLSDVHFDRLMHRLRTRFIKPDQVVPMNNIYRRLLHDHKAGILNITWFLVDQSPPHDYPFWTKFMNVETPFFQGPAKTARRLGQPVVFMSISKPRRGHYNVKFTTLVSDPGTMSVEEITQKYVQAIEHEIRQKPEWWLWSHRRWKHSQALAPTGRNH